MEVPSNSLFNGPESIQGMFFHSFTRLNEVLYSLREFDSFKTFDLIRPSNRLIGDAVVVQIWLQFKAFLSNKSAKRVVVEAVGWVCDHFLDVVETLSGEFNTRCILIHSF